MDVTKAMVLNTQLSWLANEAEDLPVNEQEREELKKVGDHFEEIQSAIASAIGDEVELSLEHECLWTMLWIKKLLEQMHKDLPGNLGNYAFTMLDEAKGLVQRLEELVNA